VTARVEAWLGRLDEAKAHGEAAKAAGTRVGLGTLEAWAGSALGHVALVEGRIDDAIDELRRVQAVHGEVVDPGELWFEADLGEALFAAGDHTATAALATNLAARAERSSSRWGLSAARRLRGLVEHDDVALKESAMLAGELGAPLEEARSLLLLAEQFDDLDAGAGALATFERCGAVRWASRARLALGDDAGSVERASTRDAHASLPEALTDAELRVAVAVARGRSNREVGDELFLSPRTIDAHLRRIYARLGIRSRAQLAVLVDRHVR
jgi:DNA-binding CsgD family transcriptional regulator